MACNCSQASEEIKRYHEMIGSCDINLKEKRNNYLNLERKIDYLNYRGNY